MDSPGAIPRRPRTSWSNDDGVFHLENVEAGEFTLELSSSTHPPLPEPRAVAFDCDKVQVLDFVLPVPGNLLVRVHDSLGNAVPETSVAVAGVAGTWIVLTDQDGEAPFGPLQPGPYIASAVVRGHAGRALPHETPTEASVETEVLQGETVAVDLRLAARIDNLGGNVSTFDGSPVADADVIVMARERMIVADGRARDRVVGRARSDENGDFEVSSLSAGDAYLIEATTSGGLVSERIAAQPGRRVDLVLPQPAALGGTVHFEAGGEPLVFEVEVGADDRRVFIHDTFIGTGGKWLIEGITPGNYRVEAIASGTRASTTSIVIAGETQDDLDLILAPTGSVIGTVLPGSSSPGGLRGDVNGWRLGNRIARVPLGPDGAFDLRSLPVGAVELRFRRRGWSRDTPLITVDVMADETVDVGHLSIDATNDGESDAPDP